MPDAHSHFHLVLALERRPGSEAAGAALARSEAQDLIATLGRDLVRLYPAIEGLDLACSAACYDPAQLLRPGWPVHAALGRLVELSPGASGRLIAFAAHEGGFADPDLMPDPALAGGPLQLVPLLLRGPDVELAALGAQLEADLLERGMAGAETALAVQAAFALPLEHARYMSLHDLCAMTTMQYRHAGLGEVWELVEGALFDAPGETVLAGDWLPPLLRRGRRVALGELDFPAWCERFGAGLDADALARRWRHWPARLAQIEAVLTAHGLDVIRVALRGENDAAALDAMLAD